MKNESNPPKFISLYAGLLAASGLIAYFLLMRLVGLAHILELRLFNFVILVAAVRWAMRLHAKLTERDYSYFQTLGVGCVTVSIAVGIFSVFMFIYLSVDHQMMEIVKQNSIIGNFLNPFNAALGVATEGETSGVIFSYIYLSYLARPTHYNNV